MDVSAPEGSVQGCSVDKLLIKGIRSFGPENKTAIEFYKPLTLIVGQNGAGKTTIIECLKQATTGDLPPNVRSGQAFIHDPKVAGESEVKAQIKLRFRTVVGKPVIAIRSFALTQKASKLEYKTLDSTLASRNAQGENVAMSARCADIDKEVPALMGVSKAILDNVIFVHQDDSNWPLGDGATLKKKFDEIFSATRYTKALEAIKKLKSEQGQQAKELRLKLEALGARQEQAARLKGDLNQDQTKATHLRSSLADAESEVLALEGRVDEMRGRVEAAGRAQEELNLMQERVGMQQQHTHQLYQDLQEEIEEPVEEIERAKAEFEAAVGGLAQRLRTAEAKVNRKKMDVEKARASVSEAGKTEGRLRAEADLHLQHQQTRRAGVQRVWEEHADLLGPLPALTSEAQVSDAVSTAGSALTSLSARVAAERDARRAEESQQAEDLLALQAKVGEAERGVEHREEQRSKLAGKIQDLQAQLQAHAGSGSGARGGIAELTDREKAARQAVEEAQKTREEDNSQAKLQTIRSEQDATVRRAQELGRVRDQLTAASEDHQRLRLLREDRAKQQEQLATLTQAQHTRLRTLMAAAMGQQEGGDPPPPGSDDPPAALNGYFNRSRSRLQSRLQAAQAECVEKQRVAAGVEASLRDAQASLAGRERVRGELRSKLVAGARKALGETTPAAITLAQQPEAKLFESRMAEETRALEAKRKSRNEMHMMSTVFNSYIARTEHDHNCPLCERHWESAQAEKAFVQHLRSNMQEAPAKLAGLDVEITKTESTLAALTGLQPSWIQMEQVGRDVVAGEAAVKDLSAQAEEARDMLDSVSTELAELEHLQRQLAAQEADMATMVRLDQSVNSLRDDISQLERRLPDAAGNDTRTIGSINSELEECERERARLEHQREEILKARDIHQVRVSSLEAAWRDAREALLRGEERHRRTQEAESQLVELREEDQVLAEEARRLREVLEPRRQEEQALRTRQQAARQVSSDLAAKLDGQLHALQRECDKLSDQSTVIREYQAAGKEAQLAKVVQSLAGLESALKADSEALERAQAELQEIDRNMKDKSGTMRSIEENLVYRRAALELEALRVRLSEAEKARGAAGDRQALSVELKGLVADLERVKQRSFTQRGTLNQLEANLAKNTKDLQSALYRDIDKLYKNKLVELRTTEMANTDLDKYYQALDKTLMKFHTDKMEEINKIIKELWQQTYQGQDIDVIQIAADMEGSAKGSYNYRLVMKCGDATLDMRGRCSAGQKVLACLIIRLALAESFCLKCGILALDEPTTNLDFKNSQALAASLLNIMHHRRHHKNFQLIVITHDERFAHMIGQREHAEYYWRVTKDNNQHSFIEREAIFA